SLDPWNLSEDDLPHLASRTERGMPRHARHPPHTPRRTNSRSAVGVSTEPKAIHSRVKWARASIAAAHSVLERKIGLYCQRLSVQLGVGIDKVVERITLLRWFEADVSSDSKL